MLRPELLKALIRHDRLVQRAVALLDDDWSRIFTQPVPFNQRRIDSRTVRVAYQLFQTGLIDSRLNFKDYGSVHQFMVRNASYLTPLAKQQLLQPFSD